MCDHTIATIRYEYVCYFSKDINRIVTALNVFFLFIIFFYDIFKYFYKNLALITRPLGRMYKVGGAGGSIEYREQFEFGNFSFSGCSQDPEIPFPSIPILKLFRWIL